MSINKIRTYLYAAAKYLGDVNAVQKGKIVKRVVRRISGGWASKILKMFIN